MRRGFGIFAVFLLLTMISFASASGLSDILNQIDETTLVLFAIFMVAFVLLFFSLKKVFRGDTTTSGIISVMLALLITYGVNKTGFDVQGLLLNIGVSGEILSTLIPIVIVAGIVFLVIFLAKNSLLVIGGLLILSSIFLYAKTLLIVVGVVLIVVRFLIPKGKWEMKGKSQGKEIRLRV
jgi:hypothetical protein